MPVHLNLYSIYLLFSCLLTLVASFIAWQRKAPGSLTLSLLMLAASFWSGCYALEWMSLSAPVSQLLPSLIYLGVLAVPPLFLIYVLQFSHHEYWVTPRILTALTVEPLITLLLISTNKYHHWMFLSVQPITGGNFNPVEIAHGPWYFVNLLYSFALIIIVFFALLLGMSHTSPLMRHQYRMVLLAASIPWLANIYIEFFSPTIKLDLTPIMFGFAGI